MITMRSLASGPSAGAICRAMRKECECDPSSGKTSPVWDVPPCRDTPHAETHPYPSSGDNQDAAGLVF